VYVRRVLGRAVLSLAHWGASRAGSDGSCPLDSLGVPMQASVPASAVGGYGETRVAFECVQPMGRDVDASDDLIVSVSSNQAVGTGDVVFGEDGLCVRARQTDSTTGQPSPRFYTITIEATDAAGNTTTETVAVTVPDLPSGMCEDGPAAAPIVLGA